MPGIVNGAMQQPVKRAVSPESERIVIAAKKVMAQPEVAKQLVQMMQSAPDPATGIAQATIFLVRQLYEKSGGAMPAKAIIPAAREILVDIMRLGQSAGIFKISQELAAQAVQKAREIFSQSMKQEQPAQPAPEAAPQAMPAEQPAPMMEA